MGKRVVGPQGEKNSVRWGNVAQDVVVEIGDPSAIRVSLGVLVHLIVSERFSTALPDGVAAISAVFSPLKSQETESCTLLRIWHRPECGSRTQETFERRRRGAQ